MGKKDIFRAAVPLPLPREHIVLAKKVVGGSSDDGGSEGESGSDKSEVTEETTGYKRPAKDTSGISDNLYVLDGRKFEDVFYTIEQGDQHLGTFTQIGIDVGQKYTRGSSPLVTGYIDSEGVDYGQRLFAGANISIVPQSPPVSISGYDGDHQNVVLRYKVVGYWSHLPISVYGRPFKLVSHTYSKSTEELVVTVDFGLSLGTQEGEFVVSLADKYTGSTFVSGPTRYKLTGTKRCDCDRRPCGDCYDNDDHCDHCDSSCDRCDSCDMCDSSCDGRSC